MDADTKKTVPRIIPYGLYGLTSQSDPVGTGTINRVSQMSIDPPLIAMGAKTETRNFANIKAGGTMALSFLGRGQGDLAFAFFGDADVDGDSFVSKENRYGYEASPSGAPVLTDAPGWADLKLVDSVETGDHAMIVAEVTEVGLHQDDPEVLTLKELGLNCGG